MKKLISLTVVIVLFFFTACNEKQTPNITDKQKAEIEKEVTAQWDLFNKAVEKADANEFITYLSDNFIAMYSQGVPLIGKQVYGDSTRVWFARRKAVEILDRKVTMNVLSKRYVMVDQESNFKMIRNDDTEETLYHTVSFLFSKEDAGWKILHGHESWK